MLAGLRRPDAGGHPAARACMANLIVVCQTRSEEAGVEPDIAAVVARRPVRVVRLLADRSSPAAHVEVLVTAHYRTRAGGRQVVGEEIILRTGGPGRRRLPSAVRALLVRDLPIVLWWVSPEAPPAAGDLFVELAPLATQVIYDSVAWPDPLRQLAVAAAWVAASERGVIADLAWRRPRLWRRLLAQTLDPTAAPAALESITQIQIEHGPHALTQAWLLAGWLAFRLGWRAVGGEVASGPEVRWTFEAPHGSPTVRIQRQPAGGAEIQAVGIVARRDGTPTTFRFEAEGPGRLAAHVEGEAAGPRRLAGPVQSRDELVARELADRARDPIFVRSMALARAMAEAVHRREP